MVRRPESQSGVGRTRIPRVGEVLRRHPKIGTQAAVDTILQRRVRQHGTIPRLWHPEVPGPLHNGRRRVPRRQIETYCRILAREFRPKRIILFGSYAYGRPTPDSDVDLVVIMPFRGGETNQVVKIRSRVESPFPMDLLVWKPEYIARRLAIGCCFMQEVLNRGKVMYERSLRKEVRLSLGLKV
ncbi:MAG: nucleotidyltransferase domain-containing protein [Verrucomicrobia bacterium]|nr:nucleotidyltransferase domain-containing protein [Verrucomicrobiota bacterium]